MSRPRMGILASVAIFLVVQSVWAQTTVSSEFGLPKVPRRVYFAPIGASAGVAQPIYRMVPDFLYTAIAAQQPIVRVSASSDAQSIVRVIPAKNGMTVLLLDSGTVVERASFAGGGDIALAKFVASTASSFSPRLGFVEPRVQLVGGAQGATSAADLVQQVRRQNELARRFEVEGGFTGFATNLVTSSPSPSFQALPLVLDFVWFPSRTIGFVGSLWTFDGSGLSSADTSAVGTTSSSTVSLQSLYVLPGLGIQYRTLGRIFGQFSARLYAGYGYFTNPTSGPVGNYDQTGTFVTFLNAGQSRPAFVTAIRLSSDFGFALTPSLGIETGTNLMFSPTAIVPFAGFVAETGLVVLQYLTLSVVYRI